MQTGKSLSPRGSQRALASAQARNFRPMSTPALRLIVPMRKNSGAAFALIALWLCMNTALAGPSYTVTDLGTLGGYNSVANSLNAQGKVAGYSEVGGTVHAFLWQNLGTLGTSATGHNFSDAIGLNAEAQVVGNSQVYDPAGEYLGRHAFLWQDGQMQDLNDLIPPGSGWTLTEARSINGGGAIIAQWTNIYGDNHAVLLSPDTTPPILTCRSTSMSVASRGASGSPRRATTSTPIPRSLYL